MWTGRKIQPLYLDQEKNSTTECESKKIQVFNMDRQKNKTIEPAGKIPLVCEPRDLSLLK